MKTIIKTFLIVSLVLAIAKTGRTQGMQMGKVIVAMAPDLKKDVQPAALKTFINKEILPHFNKERPGTNFYLFQADRGNEKGKLLLVCSHKTNGNRERMPAGSPFKDKVLNSRVSSSKASDFFSNTDAFTEYQLIGSENISSLPSVDILGVHFIKVKEERKQDFEKFVAEKMHPVVGNLLPDMHLLTYKAGAGDQKGSYVTVFAITSVEARDQYWPAGKPETAILKQAFLPLKELANELEGYLVEGSYLEPSGGAAAIFESKEWTDYIYQSP